MIQLNKMLKILFAIEFILILAIIALAFIESNEAPTAYAVKEIQSAQKNGFKLLTKAVCEEKSDHTFCHDEIFIKCNGKEYLINENNSKNFTECSTKLDLLDIKVSGHAVFTKEWVDKRT